MSASDVFAWLAVLLLPISAVIGWFLQRWGSGSFRLRMRPHFVLGYAALVLAIVHMMLSAPDMAGANTDGIWLAGLGVIGLGLQAFVGTNLQSPGVYRVPLRRWHTVVFWAVTVLVLGHIVLNAPFFQ